jgi:hypothetical protein
MSVMNSQMQKDIRPTRGLARQAALLEIFLYSFRRRNAMRLARRALVAALVTLTLCAAASAQTLRNENDPRNIAPTVGTGGPVGGPTGLFTIYDGQTLRKGEFTFSIAYSNFDRDPGDADIVEVPVSFQIGLSDYLELFFNTDAYRGIRVNSPANLSSFYLPNSRLLGNGGCSSPAIVAAPVGNVGTIAGTAVFRPVCSAPFVNYPFFGGNAGNFQQGNGSPGAFFGFPGFNAVIGNPVLTGDGGNFGAADLFPGIGSPVGSILPGIVLATSVLPGTPNLIFRQFRVPATFTIAPTYLNDAPFINREYGESSFSTFVVGGKIRFTEPDNAFGVALIPFYRFYADKADDASGFRNLQRGASPGGNIGDFGLVFAVDGRLSRSSNISANFGYILNSNPKIGDAVILDRPNEFLAGVGFDFPINKHFQIIAEVRSTQYVGGRTPNAFENSPVDALAGLRIFPKRWYGFGFAYRYHLNNQNRDLFNPKQASTNVTPFNITIAAPGPGLTTFTFPATSVLATEGAFPRNFNPTDDANGFIVQFWVGKRNDRAPEYLPNQPPTVTLTPASATVNPPCPPGLVPDTDYTPSSGETVQLSANATDPDGDTLLYTYSTTGGRVTGEGPNVSWDLAGVQPGTYTATVEVDDGCGCVAFSSTTVTVNGPRCHPPCPEVRVDCPSGITEAGTPITFTANVTGGAPGVTATYNWSVSAGTITGGQGTPSITVDTKGLGGQSITATVQVGGYPPECQTTASCTAQVGITAICRKFDEYGNIAFNDEKARLDNFAIQLQNEPGSQGYIVAYGSCAGEAQRRADRAKDYLVTTRGLDPGRITVVAADNCAAELTVELHICPTGATNIPTTAARTDLQPCPECRPARRGRRGTARRRGGRRRGEE